MYIVVVYKVKELWESIPMDNLFRALQQPLRKISIIFQILIEIESGWKLKTYFQTFSVILKREKSLYASRLAIIRG